MDQSYYKSKLYKKSLSNKITNTIFEDLVKVTCHPAQHPANYLTIDELKDHPYLNLVKKELYDIKIECFFMLN